jgi:thiosulfate reductase cytochrome b subunit
VILIMSGLQIFNAHPFLYASDASDPAKIVFSLPQTQDANEGTPPRHRMVLFGHAINTGSFGMEGFPSTVTLGGWLAGARRLHFATGWIFVLTGATYLSYMLLSRRKRAVWPWPVDFRQAPAALRNHLKFPPVLEGPHGALNPLQKMAYAAIPLLLAPLSIATGLALSPQWDAAFHFWPQLFGGRQFARTWHFIAVGLFVGFIVIHVLLVSLGGWPTLRRMLTGRVTQDKEVS